MNFPFSAMEFIPVVFRLWLQATTIRSTQECLWRHYDISPEFVNDDMICTLSPIDRVCATKTLVVDLSLGTLWSGLCRG